MPVGLRSWGVLGYLGAVLLLGGASAAGFSGNALLALGGAVLIGWCVWSPPKKAPVHTGLGPFLIALAVLAALQFLPLPPAIWSNLPGRERVAEGFGLVGAPLPWLNLTLDPWGALQSVVWWIPPAALLLAMRTDRAPETRHVVWLVMAAAYAMVLLGALQALGGTGYIYAFTNIGNAVGLFANSNHFGSFLLATIALAAGQFLHDRPRPERPRLRRVHTGLLALQLAPLVVGVILSQSLACMLLLVPLFAGIAMMALPQLKIRWPIVALLGAVALGGLVWLLQSGLVANDLAAKNTTAGISRGEFVANGLLMARDFAPFGSGLSTFRELYPWYESVDQVGTTFVNHAHNDLLELVIETGVFGLIVLGLFLAWLGKTGWALWNAARTENPVALGATLAIAAVLAHSLVDYPLRTAAVSSLVAICCVLARRPAAPRGAAAQAGPGAGKREMLLQI